MSVAGNYHGGLEVTQPVLLTTTNLTDIVEGYDRFSTVASWAITNTKTGTVHADIFLYDGTTDWEVYCCSIGSHQTIIVSDLPLRLRDGMKMKAQADTANQIVIVPVVIRTHANEPVTNWSRVNR